MIGPLSSSTSIWVSCPFPSSLPIASEVPIPVDAIVSPTRKINFSTEPVHAGRETSHERLILEVWTDGTTSPVDAISRAAGILVEQLNPFVDYVKVSQMKAEEQLIRLSIPDEKYNMPVEQLDLSVRTMNCLRRGGVATVGELISKKPKDLLQLRNFGQKSFREIEDKLKELGLSLSPQVGVKDETASEEESSENIDIEADIAQEDEPQSGEAEDEA